MKGKSLAKIKIPTKNAVISLLLAFLLIFTSLGAYASISDVPSDASYADAINRITSLGIMDLSEGKFKPNDLVTREEFAKYMITVSGLQEDADLLKNTSYFSDVNIGSTYNGYVNAAVDNGFITGKPDGKFYPTENINFSQVVTALVEALDYNENDLTGTWPYNFLKKANEIGLTEDISLQSTDDVPRWAMAVLLDHLIKTPLKNKPTVTFAEQNSLYLETIVLETPDTSDLLGDNEIITNKGTFFVKDNQMFEPGKKYWLGVEDDTVTNVYGSLGGTVNISVKSAVGTKVTYNDENIIKTIDLPSKTTYYYKGQLQSYGSIANLLQVNSSIVLKKNENGIGFEYGVIYDPIYSRPEIAINFDLTNNRLGAIKIDENEEITKNGSMIRKEDIEDKDVLYQVSDIWGINKYILVVDEKVEGEITNILPNKVSPKIVQINNVNYELGNYMDLSKINSQGLFKTDDSVTALLGYDGKVVDIIGTSSEDNSNFALVLDNYTKTSTAIEDFGTEINYVKLLHIDGTSKTYKLNTDDNGYNGDLVKYKILPSQEDDDVDTVVIEKVDYLASKEYTIDKEKKKIDSNYFADNIKIFNIVMPISGGDSDAYLMDWSDLPNGVIPPGKIKFMNKVGPFEDVNVLFVDNILDEGLKQGIVTSIKTQGNSRQGLIYTNTILVDGKEYTTNLNIKGLYEGVVVRVRMRNEKIFSLEGMKSPYVEGSSINAIDSKRIKIKGNIYEFKNNVGIYFMDYDGNYERKGINDIVANQEYGRISLYLDKATKYDGKVELIVVQPY